MQRERHCFVNDRRNGGDCVITPVETWLINLFGWQNTLLIFGAVFVLIVVPSALFIMKENVPEHADGVSGQGTGPNIKEQPDITWKDAFKTRAYWQVVFGLFACGFGMKLLGSHGVPMLVDHGFDPMIASLGVGTIGLLPFSARSF